MSKKQFLLTRSTKGIVTFQYGKYIESFDVEVVGIYETYERIKWAAITAGLTLTEETMEQLTQEARGLLEHR